MKPRIRKYGKYWYCGEGFNECRGRTPIEAYNYWALS